jgi:hypothetical protein
MPVFALAPALGARDVRTEFHDGEPVRLNADWWRRTIQLVPGNTGGGDSVVPRLPAAA